MSYILDALKKSEQDRGNGSIPSIQTVHSSALNYHQGERPLWPWILIAVLIINIFILVYFFRPTTNTENVTPAHSATTNAGAVPNQTRQVIKNEFVTAPVATPAPAITAAVTIEPTVEPEAPAPSNSFATAETMIDPQTKPLVDISELPADIRHHIPSMVFSAHVYSSAPSQRSLVINNRFMEEGDAVSYDLILLEITRQGAIFYFRDYRFSISVLSGWNTR